MKAVVRMVEHAFMNRAEFAMGQYRRALLHIDALSTEERERVKREVKQELKYVVELLEPTKKSSPSLSSLSKQVRGMINEDFAPRDGSRKINNFPMVVKVETEEEEISVNGPLEG